MQTRTLVPTFVWIALFVVALVPATSDRLVAEEPADPSAQEVSVGDVEVLALLAGGVGVQSCGASELSALTPLVLELSTPSLEGAIAPAVGCGGYPSCIGFCGAIGFPGDPCVCKCTCEC